MPFYGGDSLINSTLVGTWDQTTGKISFHLTTVMTYNATVNKGTQNEESGTSTTIYEYEGDGEMTSENQAGGDASYTLTCTTTNPKAVGCNPTARVQ